MQWGCSGLLLEVLMRNFLLQANLTEKNVESLVSCDLEVNYNNMHKVRGKNRMLLSFYLCFGSMLINHPWISVEGLVGAFYRALEF